MTKEPKQSKGDGTRLRAAAWVSVGLVLYGAYLFLAGSPGGEVLSYSDFTRKVEAGEVEEVLLAREELRGRLRAAAVPAEGTPHFTVVRIDDPDLFDRLRTREVKVSGLRPPSPWLQWMPLVLVAGYLFWRYTLARSEGTEGGTARFLTLRQGRLRVDVQRDVGVSFADVAGVDEAKEELQEVVEFLRTPQKFRRLGGRMPRGILLVGPPGTGKTLLARAVAGEARVPFFRISGSEFVEMFVGVGAARVRDLFEQARAQAPCIVFIDELDALGRTRGAGATNHEEREQTLNQLLVEMDGFDPRANVILMAATNRPEILDPALLRAGRFDRQVLVDRPDRSGRLAILRLHARNVVLENPADLDGVAAMTPGMAGADMANLVNEAALLAVRRGKDRVGRAELEEAVERVVAGLQKKNRVLNPAERERVAHHEVGHALVGLALPSLRGVKKISIIPRGISALGYTVQEPTGDRFLLTQTELEARIAQLLGGRVAEALVFGEPSTGAQDDLARATQLARSMVESYGMSAALGPVSYEAGGGPTRWIPAESDGARVGEALTRRIDAEVARILHEQEVRVTELLRAREAHLRRAAKALLERETLTGEELLALGEPTPVPARVA